MTLNANHIRELLDASTPGQWTVEDDGYDIIIGNAEGHRVGWGDQVRFKFEAGDEKYDPALAALAPELAAEYLRLRRELADFRAALQDGATNPELTSIDHSWCEAARDGIDRILNGDHNA